MNVYEKYNNHAISWPEFIFSKISEKDFSTLLEVGCGNGMLWQKNEQHINNNWNIHLSDSSSGMVQESHQNLGHLSNINFWVFPVSSIAFNDNIFNVVLANHMLYLVDHLSVAILEIKRVLTRDGMFYATTATANHRKELNDFIQKATGTILPNEIQSFSDQNSVEILSDYFDTIEISYYKDVLKIPKGNSLIEYVNSLRSVKLLDAQCKSRLVEYIHHYFEENEFFFLTKEFVLLTCSDL
jgi:ubiquinone/menaquinone biosynthesis C-methylase UbiE